MLNLLTLVRIIFKNIDTTDYDINSLVSDEETFIEEITEQISKRLKRLKTKTLKNEDLVRRRYNEQTLYKKQLEYVHKVDKNYQALIQRDDIADNREMVEEIKNTLRKNAERKKKLLNEGKPDIDLNYNRMI
jgi:hypothetical protein